MVVSDKQAVQACLQFAEDFQSEKHLIEPACGAALAVLSNELAATYLDGAKLVVVIVCGGSAVCTDMLRKWKSDLQIT